VILEAMAAGLPTVATRVGGIPEVVRDGETGCLIPPRDPGALARAIADLLDQPDLRAVMARTGRRVVEEQFTMDKAIADTATLYADLAADSRAAAAG
jgi:glycosyltransferase involved in cell wall biosynthesis